MTVRDERGDIVLRWLFRLVLMLAVFGFFAFEAGAVIVARVTVESVADDTANEAAGSYAHSHDPDAAEQAARDFAQRNNATLVAFSVSDGGKAVSVTVTKRAKTIILHKFGPTKSWTIATATREKGVL